MPDNTAAAVINNNFGTIFEFLNNLRFGGKRIVHTQSFCVLWFEQFDSGQNADTVHIRWDRVFLIFYRFFVVQGNRFFCAFGLENFELPSYSPQFRV